jgi:hypothetical protein
MGDDWRLQIGLFEHGHAHTLTEHLAAGKLGDDLEEKFGERLVVSSDPPNVFVYAGSRAQAEAAEGTIREVAAEHHWDIEIQLTHWHPTAEDWEDPDKPLPTTDAERLAEHQALLAQEREDSDIRGYPEYEVRIECPSHHDTVKLDKRLHDEGFDTVRRWKYLLIGADDEDSANALAERLRGEAPQGSTVTAEASLRQTYDDEPTRGSFAIFGGLGG